MAVLLMIADDLTGALDSGVAFVNAGVKTEILVNPDCEIAPAAEAYTAVVVNSQTRHLTPKAASQTVQRICQKAKQLNIPIIYKKTDSALRGNIGAELEAALTGSGRDYVYFAPAYPRIGRTTVGGVQYIDGVPVGETSFAKDLLNPVTDSYIPDIIRAQSRLPVIRENLDAAEAPAILLADSADEQDLRDAAKYAIQHQKTSVIAGCAGLACEIAGYLPAERGMNVREKPEKPFLVFCGSIHPVSRAQADYAADRGLERIWLDSSEIIAEHYWDSEKGRELINRLIGLLGQNGTALAENTYHPDEAMTKEEQDRMAARLPEAFGELAGALLAKQEIGTLMVFGGDILAGLVKALQITSIEPLGELEPGVVLAKTARDKGTLRFIAKAGSFGRKELIAELAESI